MFSEIWEYGKPGEQYPCWTVLKHDGSETGICYCDFGFGWRSHWGLVWLGDEQKGSMGMDTALVCMEIKENRNGGK